MNSKTLYMSFTYAIKNGLPYTEMERLRGMVRDTIGIHQKMPDKTLANTFRRKLFSENLTVPPDRVEKYNGALTDIFGENYEDLFKI